MNILNIKTMKTIKLLALLFISTLVFTGCSDDDDHDDDHDHEDEVITTLIYTLTDGNDVITLSYLDLDPNDTVEGTYTVSGNLTANTQYVGAITLLNATDDDPEHIQEEIEEEAEEHEFFYSTDISDLAITKTDEDADGNPVGFTTTLTTGAAGDGTLTITLLHEPTKPNDGTVADAGGSTDIEVSFDVTVE